MHTKQPRCAQCHFKPSERLCRTEDGRAPDFCPSKNLMELAEKSRTEYTNSQDIYEFAKQAALQEISGYTNSGGGNIRATKTRIEEVIEFAERMNYKRLGMGFCIGLRKEANVVDKLFSSRGFEVVSAVCKVGRTSKQHIGISRDQQLDPTSTESMCNPILQAMTLNHEKTDFNVLLGLCVGHDSLFFKYCEAPCTVLAVKDRVLGHNPLAAVYNMDSYYKCLK